MKCNGKVGYFLNLKKEYGDRADIIFKKLEEKNVQGAFITDFIKIDFINITKVLLFLIKNNKVRTCFDGLYIDKKYSNFFFLENEKVFNEIDKNEKSKKNDEIEKVDENILVNNGINLCVSNSEEIQDDLNKSKCIKGNMKNNLNENTNEYLENNSENAKNYYKKIIIQKSELLNINDIMNYDGSIENINKIMYYLNPCSVISAYFMNIKKNECVLDMCASPGGKSLVIANKLFGYGSSPLNRINNININDKDIEINCCLNMVNYYKMNREGLLVINEYNKVRYDRLKQVLNKYLPNDLTNSNNIHITNYNGLNLNSFMRFPKFHKILLDVPCSSDGYLLKKNTNDIKKWSFNIIKNNSNVQIKLLYNSFHLLHLNGFIIYSTCALSHYENDYVIEKLLKKFGNQVKIIDFIEEEFQRQYKKILYSLQRNNNMKNYVTENISDKTNDLKSENIYNSKEDNDKNNLKSSVSNNCNSDDSNFNYQNSNDHNNSTFYNNKFNEFKEKSKFLKFFEKTKYGYISLPDKSPFGILYICKIQKI
ncbi:tRNA m5C-methyltransferase, putative [Plasmodium relictum]|uniref:NOL1/NOP2/Sun domain family member 4 n=1 Tax=Plasmodium relictum TaxID=85471 RepID=A0A1J1H4X2_PLARL|nr:tRNA m5C-methyltransferase, putative [Plasmodium relictum]CRG99980.1 tRNA m5C-methyltransferase, putative [Plasmodium relictum]